MNYSLRKRKGTTQCYFTFRKYYVRENSIKKKQKQIRNKTRNKQIKKIIIVIITETEFFE